MDRPVVTDRAELEKSSVVKAGAETHRRSLLKTIIWRVIATTVTMLFSFIWLDKWSSALELALAANVTKSFLYYAHERLWNKSDFGRKKRRDDYTV